MYICKNALCKENLYKGTNLSGANSKVPTFDWLIATTAAVKCLSSALCSENASSEDYAVKL